MDYTWCVKLLTVQQSDGLWIGAVSESGGTGFNTCVSSAKLEWLKKLSGIAGARGWGLLQRYM